MESIFSKLPMLAISRGVRKPRPGQICFRLFEGRLALSSGVWSMEHVLIDANTFPADNASTSFSPCADRGPEFLASLGGFSGQPVLSPCLDRVI
jgi:hypothetical protein